MKSFFNLYKKNTADTVSSNYRALGQFVDENSDGTAAITTTLAYTAALPLTIFAIGCKTVVDVSTRKKIDDEKIEALIEQIQNSVNDEDVNKIVEKICQYSAKSYGSANLKNLLEKIETLINYYDHNRETSQEEIRKVESITQKAFSTFILDETNENKILKGCLEKHKENQAIKNDLLLLRKEIIVDYLKKEENAGTTMQHIILDAVFDKKPPLSINNS